MCAAHFPVSAIALNKTQAEKIFTKRKVPRSVDVPLIIFNWTQRGLETAFLASASAKRQFCQHKTEMETETERIFCQKQTRGVLVQSEHKSGRGVMS